MRVDVVDDACTERTCGRADERVGLGLKATFHKAVLVLHSWAPHRLALSERECK